MIHKTLRIGRFTSSNAAKLVSCDKSGTGFGVPGLTYIEEKRAERCLGRSIDVGAYSQEMTWGKVCEFYLFKYVLGLNYSLISKETIVHSEYPFWSGSPDFENEELQAAGEIKCYYPKKFFLITKCIMAINEGELTLDSFKSNFKEEYWQVLSNSILLNKSVCEVIIFTPTEQQLLHIRELIEDSNFLESIGLELWMGRFIVEKQLYELPYIPEHSEYPNMVTLVFIPPKEDVEFLTSRMVKAEELLNGKN